MNNFLKNKIFHPYTPFSAIEKGFPNMVRGEGIYLFDDQGNRYVDIVSSWWACALGHSHPKIVAAIQQQAAVLQHSITGSLTHPGVLALADRLAHLMPTPDRHSVFASDGCSAVEAALKISIQYFYNTGRPEKCWIIGMDQGYHGDSLGALGAGFVDGFHKPFERAVPHHAKLPFPVPTESDPNGFEPSRNVIEQHAAQLAAVIVEPLCLGSAGMKIYSAGYLKQLADCCAANDVLLIVDEIAMGFGRTGKRFAFNHADIDPDMVCVGKALTAGAMPLSACIVKDKIYNTFSDKLEHFTNEMPFDSLVGRGCHFLRALPRNNEASLPLVESRIRERVIGTGSLNTETRSEAFGTKTVTNRNVNPVLQNQDAASQPLCALVDHTFYHGNTFAGHPIGCAAALAALDIYEAEDTVARAAELAEKMKQWMLPMAEMDCVKELRFLGMIGVVELKPEFKPLVAKIKQSLFEQGWLFRPLGTVFYLMPPLVISESELKAAVDALHESIHDAVSC